MRPQPRSWLPALLALATGCTGAAGDAPARVPLSVFAASSLKESFEALEAAFEAQQPGVDVQLSFAGSQVLRLQIEQGAGADVFASADEAHMQALVDAGRVGDATLFAHNELALIVPARGAVIGSFAELPRAPRVVLGSPNVPVGRYARTLLSRADGTLGTGFAEAVRSHVVSEEGNVRLVRAKVELGEADAALVYATDAAASEGVVALPIPAELSVRASYPIGTLRGSPHAAQAKAFVAFVRSEAGQRVLAAHGFTGAPSP